MTISSALKHLDDEDIIELSENFIKELKKE